MTDTQSLREAGGAAAFLQETARYFKSRPTGGEDREHWANVSNAENCCRAALLIEAQAREIEVLRAERDEARALAERLREALGRVQHVIDNGYPTPGNKVDQCQHGKFGWEDCIACYDEALLAALTHPMEGAR